MAYFRCGGGSDTSIVTALASDVLSPKVIVDAEGNPLTGTMPNNGAVSSALNCGGSYTIPKGYHNGSGKVTANSLASQGASAIKTGSFTPTETTATYPTTITICTIAGVSSVPKYFIAYIDNILKDNNHGIKCYTSSSLTIITHFVLKFSDNIAYAGVYNTGSPLGGYDSSYYSFYDYRLKAQYDSTGKTLTLTLINHGGSTKFESKVCADTWNYLIVY